MNYITFVVIFIITFISIKVESARILGITPAPTASHYILGHTLMKELALRGHDITFINAFGQKQPIKNYKDIILKGFAEEMEAIKKKMMNSTPKLSLDTFTQFMRLTSWMAERVINSTEVLDLLKSNQKFDLIIMESFMSESHVGFAHHFDCPLVILSALGSNFFINHLTRNPAPVSYIPQIFSGMSGKMSFMDRLINTLLSAVIEVTVQVYHLPIQNELMHKYIPNAPHLRQVINERLSLILMNSHPSISPAKPSVPNMIEIGGYHVEDPKELPKDLKECLDNAKEGFILFSMGSNIKSIMLPEEKRNILLKVFGNLPYKILWKFEDENLPGKPKNVKIGKWLPQNDILAHPNIKLFITQGGLLSITESVYHGVPIVGIPVVGDQKMNMENAQNLKIGKALDFNELSYDKLMNAVQEVLTNKIYVENVKKRSKLMKDQPMKPIDTAMFWIEYALRNKYAKHLRTSAMEMEWWEIENLDVYVVLIGAVLLFVYFLIWAIKKYCCSNKTTKLSQEKKKRE